MAGDAEQQLRAYVEYLRDMGVHDFYRQGEPLVIDVVSAVADSVELPVARSPLVPTAIVVDEPRETPVPSRPAFLEPPIAKLVSFDDLAPLPEIR
ncbi:MAG: uracil-DNA glycosylase, partial [Edaphobacter sp.]